jgi:hypothetical protein
MARLTIIDTIQKQMETDDENRFKQEKYLLQAYNNGSIDDFLIALCGWGFESIKELNNEENREQ